MGDLTLPWRKSNRDLEAERAEARAKAAERDARTQARLGRIWEQRDLRDAYERGRRDERARRRRSPVLAAVAVLSTVAIVGALALAGREGSFGRAGTRIDETMAAASDQVQKPVRNAADEAGAALEDAGHSLRRGGG